MISITHAPINRLNLYMLAFVLKCFTHRRIHKMDIFTVVISYLHRFFCHRSIRDLFFSKESDQLGLFGAFGYDLTFQFEPIGINKPRDFSQRDLVLYLPDKVLVVDNAKKDAWELE